MKLTTLALNNIKHNMKNYTMYFFAMCFCVFTTFSFANLTFSESVYTKVIYDTRYQNMFIGFGIIIMVFVLFFLISSNNSFIRYRKKEISTYALFGMENAKIGRLLFFETLLIGMAALVIGILLGVFFSKLLAMVLLKMMLAEYAHVTFDIESKALIITVVMYLVTFSLMGMSGFRTISKFQLVDLFKGDRVSEKRTKGSYILLIISLCLIGYAYYLAASENGYTVASVMLPVIGMTVVGSYLFFLGGLQKIIYLFKKNKRYLYKKERLISTSMLSHKARTFATTMGTIAVLIATSTTAMAFGYTLYESGESNAKEVNSFDVYYYADNAGLEQKIYNLLEEHNSQPTDTIKFQRYVCQPKAENMPEDYQEFLTGSGSPCSAYSQTTFNEIVKVAHDSNQMISVEKGNVKVLYPNYQIIGDAVSGNILFGDTALNAEFEQVFNSYNFGTMLTMVFNDEDYEALKKQGLITTKVGDNEYWPFVGINYKNSLTNRAIAKDLTQLFKNTSDVGSHRILYNSYIEGMEIFGLVCFIGYFVCAVFILMSVSLLYFKQVAIGTEEADQYRRLRKIGMDSQQEANAVRSRIAPVFFIPLFMGLIHSVFAMKGADTMIFSNMILSSGNTFLQVLKISSVMYAIYTVIYLAFYFITKYKYMRVIANK